MFAGRDEISIAEGPAFSELPLGEILNPTTFRIDPLFSGSDFKNFEEIRGTLSLWFTDASKERQRRGGEPERVQKRSCHSGWRNIRT